jgi:HEPN domain-containing protein
MSPPERFPPDDPWEWLNWARSNLTRAKSKLTGVYLEDLCFDAQQAAEKVIKAMMIRRNVEFPYVQPWSSFVAP